MTPVAWHTVAHARTGRLPLDAPDQALWLWSRLQLRYPSALAATLMPNHLHLVTPEEPEPLAPLLRTFSRQHHLGETWDLEGPPEPILGLDKLARQLRYVELNSCRPFLHEGRRWRLVDDPLCWPWTTHRDVVGAVVRPWVTSERLCQQLGWPAKDFLASWHRYVSADRWTSPQGQALPRLFVPERGALPDLADLSDATCAALRCLPEAVQRRGPARDLFLDLALLGGWNDLDLLAEVCDVTQRTLQRHRRRRQRPGLLEARFCLGDTRLRLPPVRRAGWRPVSATLKANPAHAPARVSL